MEQGRREGGGVPTEWQWLEHCVRWAGVDAVGIPSFTAEVDREGNMPFWSGGLREELVPLWLKLQQLRGCSKLRAYHQQALTSFLLHESLVARQGPSCIVMALDLHCRRPNLSLNVFKKKNHFYTQQDGACQILHVKHIGSWTEVVLVRASFGFTKQKATEFLFIY